MLHDGGEVVERLVQEGKPFHRYVVTGGPMPLRDFEPTLSMRADGPAWCDLEWTATYEAARLPHVQAAGIVRSVVVDGLAKSGDNDHEAKAAVAYDRTVP